MSDSRVPHEDATTAHAATEHAIAPARANGTGAFAPFRTRAFTVIWLASLAGNIGVWMRDTTSAWLMTGLTTSPTMVAAIQAAAMLPVFLLSIPAGALADIVDRRRYLILVQVGLALVSATLAVTVASGTLSASALLVLTLAAGIGTALGNPAWQSVTPELVPRPVLREAIALNSLGFNLARAVGPALAGLIVAAFGAAYAYGADVVSYLFVIAALVWWPRAPRTVRHPEQFGGAVAAGLRHAWRSRGLKRAIGRAVVFFAFASAYWALLPLIAKHELGGDAGAYGVLLGALGGGAIAGALLLPRLRRRASSDAIVLGGTLVTAASMAGLALAPSVAIAVPWLMLAGAAWIAVLTSLNGVAQAVLPDWVRARGLAAYLTAFYGAMTLGSLVWGAVAERLSLDATLLVAAAGAALVGLVARAWPLPAADADLTPSHPWPEPVIAHDAMRGPTLVTIEYRVDPSRHAALHEALAPLGVARRRDGAIEWGAYVDVAEPTRVIEWFVAPSWEEHLRHHDRVTAADAALQAAANALHEGPGPPRVTHHVRLGAPLP